MQSNATWPRSIRHHQVDRLDNGAIRLLGFQIPNYTFPGVTNDKLFEHVVMLATTAQKAGFDSVWVMDHFYQLPNIGPRTDPMLEGYATLAGIAARTRKVRLGTLVTGVTYRNPAFLAKEATTLDIVSSGRAVLGLGAAWNEDEHRGAFRAWVNVSAASRRRFRSAGLCSVRTRRPSRVVTTRSVAR
jgi:alkanesulfonate monooxygenase SsuD/methylene tetrahydromethanopterin reductase-like flavin-dependent oxidoreductase (luciferase family)